MLRDPTRLERPATGGASTAGTVPAVVVNVGWVPGVSTIQALGRAGIPVHAVDHRPSALGFRSRYAVPHLCPSALQDERGFIDGLARLAAQLPGPAPIFPVDDEDMA